MVPGFLIIFSSCEQGFFFLQLESVQAALNKYHILGGLQQQIIYYS